ncbi:MAG: class I SAM-dependent methyltransferase [Nanoarchaeota archaeon]|nr:class I SAM-dependent methyltransferase [Nanoarchaeota archaeon]
MTEQLKIISKKEYLRNHKKPSQKKVWDNISGPWEEYRGKPVPIVNEFLTGKSGLVVDLGCGNARNMINNSSITYYGVDFSYRQIENAFRRTEKEKINAVLFQEDITKLNKEIFKDNMFDYGLFIATLHCIETSTKRKNSLKGLYRVLKPGAEALISVWNSKNPRFKCVNNSGDIYMSWKEKAKIFYRYYYLFSKQEFLDLIESVGFKVIEFYTPREHDRFSKKNWIVKVQK